MPLSTMSKLSKLSVFEGSSILSLASLTTELNDGYHIDGREREKGGHQSQLHTVANNTTTRNEQKKLMRTKMMSEPVAKADAGSAFPP